MTDAPRQRPLPLTRHTWSPPHTASHLQPLPLLRVVSLPLRRALPPAMWRVCTCAPLRSSFFSCSINLSSQPDVGRASCIPNTKNNHFSVTGGGEGGCLEGMAGSRSGGGWVGVGGTKGVGGWGMSGGLFQLAGTRFNCSYSSRGGVMGRKKGCVLFFFSSENPHNPQNVECMPL